MNKQNIQLGLTLIICLTLSSGVGANILTDTLEKTGEKIKEAGKYTKDKATGAYDYTKEKGFDKAKPAENSCPLLILQGHNK